MQELKPCPFCDSVSIYTKSDGRKAYVCCYDCKAQVVGDDIGEAIEKWNRRANECKWEYDRLQEQYYAECGVLADVIPEDGICPKCKRKVGRVNDVQSRG